MHPPTVSLPTTRTAHVPPTLDARGQSLEVHMPHCDYPKCGQPARHTTSCPEPDHGHVLAWCTAHAYDPRVQGRLKKDGWEYLEVPVG